MNALPHKPPATRSFWRTMVAIAWSFVGLRRRKDFDDDVSEGFSPFFVLLAALIGVALFIGTLMAVVAWVVP